MLISLHILPTCIYVFFLYLSTTDTNSCHPDMGALLRNKGNEAASGTSTVHAAHLLLNGK